MRRNAFALALTALLTAAALSITTARPVPADDTDVDLQLVLAVDVSRSMDHDEQRLQRDGYIAALTHRDVIEAILGGARHRIALSYIEWAGPETQYVAVDWRLIDSAASAEAFAEALARAPLQAFRGTSISDGITFVRSRFDGNGYTSPRRVIDVSGDGPNNMGMPIEPARDSVIGDGITINGLPIMIKQAWGFASIDNLDVYYRDCVIGGPGAFLLVVRSVEQFAEAIRRKLVLEIADRAPAARLLPIDAPGGDSGTDCLIGEKLRQQWMRE
jgi:hypothetical protein